MIADTARKQNYERLKQAAERVKQQLQDPDFPILEAKEDSLDEAVERNDTLVKGTRLARHLLRNYAHIAKRSAIRKEIAKNIPKEDIPPPISEEKAAEHQAILTEFEERILGMIESKQQPTDAEETKRMLRQMYEKVSLLEDDLIHFEKGMAYDVRPPTHLNNVYKSLAYVKTRISRAMQNAEAQKGRHARLKKAKALPTKEDISAKGSYKHDKRLMTRQKPRFAVKHLTKERRKELERKVGAAVAPAQEKKEERKVIIAPEEAEQLKRKELDEARIRELESKINQTFVEEPASAKEPRAAQKSHTFEREVKQRIAFEHEDEQPQQEEWKVLPVPESAVEQKQEIEKLPIQPIGKRRIKELEKKVHKQVHKAQEVARLREEFFRAKNVYEELLKQKNPRKREIKTVKRQLEKIKGELVHYT